MGIIAALNDWYQQLHDRRQRLRGALATTTSQAGHSWAAKASPLGHAQSLLEASLLSIEWLRFACRLLLLLVKHTGYMSQVAEGGTAWEEHLAALQKIVAELPPAKCSDIRNGF